MTCFSQLPPIEPGLQGKDRLLCAVRSPGSVRWGCNELQMPSGSPPSSHRLCTPARLRPSTILQVPDLHGIMQLACGGLHSLALRSSGQALAWGANQNGVLGLGSGKGIKQSSRTPEPLPGFSAEQLAAGWKHSAAVAGGGRMYTWGWGGSQGGWAGGRGLVAAVHT